MAAAIEHRQGGRWQEAEKELCQKMNIEYRTTNVERRRKSASYPSMFDISCSIFDIIFESDLGSSSSETFPG
jgi:hypothetical protein